jgi:allantoinase
VQPPGSGSIAALAVAGGTVVTPWGPARATILVRGERIAAVAAPEERVTADTVIDATNRIVLPGLVDPHVHLDDPGRADWEGVLAGTRAAAAGGVTTVIEMPLNASPPTIDAEALAAKRAAFRGRSLVDYALWGGLVTDNTASLDGLLAGGVCGLKAFMCAPGTDDFPRATDAVLLSGLGTAGARGVPVGVHCENEDITASLAAALRRKGRRDLRAFAESRPPVAEIEAVGRALCLAQAADASLYAVHLSTPGAVDMIARARRRGQRAYAETCPHYLTLTEDALDLGAAAKCAPPLRPPAFVEALWKRVLDGRVHTIGSDHSPCPDDLKTGDGWAAWGGICGIQTMLPLLLDEGVHRRRLPLERLADLVAAAPARIFGLAPRKGALLPGADADMVIVDPHRMWRVAREDLKSRFPHSPFIGRELRGAPECTIVRGRVVYRDGECTGDPGYGREIVRTIMPHRRNKIGR